MKKQLTEQECGFVRELIKCYNMIKLIIFTGIIAFAVSTILQADLNNDSFRFILALVVGVMLSLLFFPKQMKP